MNLAVYQARGFCFVGHNPLRSDVSPALTRRGGSWNSVTQQEAQSGNQRPGQTWACSGVFGEVIPVQQKRGKTDLEKVKERERLQEMPGEAGQA